MDSISKSNLPKIRIDVDQLVSMIRQVKETPADRQPFSSCTARYDGMIQEGVVDRFIVNLTTFKVLNQVSDDDAVNGLSYLLTNQAKSCWEREKLKKPTWTEAMKWLKTTYDPNRPAYVIYQDIVSLKQEENVSLKDFVEAKLKMFNRLSFDDLEEMKLDMVYGQLLEKYKCGIPRETISNLTQLLDVGGGLEKRWMEADKEQEKKRIDSLQKNKTKKRKIRCGFCKIAGHELPLCRVRIRILLEKEQNAKALGVSFDETNLGCYRCGAPGRLQLKCRQCPKISTSKN